jgi:hypothetical protein
VVIENSTTGYSRYEHETTAVVPTELILSLELAPQRSHWYPTLADGKEAFTSNLPKTSNSYSNEKFFEKLLPRSSC